MKDNGPVREPQSPPLAILLNNQFRYPDYRLLLCLADMAQEGYFVCTTIEELSKRCKISGLNTIKTIDRHREFGHIDVQNCSKEYQNIHLFLLWSAPRQSRLDEHSETWEMPEFLRQPSFSSRLERHPSLDARAQKAGYDSYEAYCFSPQWRSTKARLCEVWGTSCCLACNAPRAVAHHIDYTRVFNERLGDLFLFCYSCHETVHEYHRFSGTTVMNIAGALKHVFKRTDCTIQQVLDKLKEIQKSTI
jgi:hypothetical protein